MTGQEMVALSKQHSLYEWSAQAQVDPIPVAGAKGVYFWTPEGKRFIDFNSQLMCVNIGHGDERVIRAIAEQAATLPYANPFMATEARARLIKKMLEDRVDVDATPEVLKSELIARLIDQRVQVCRGEMGAAQFLPAIHPELPEVRIAEESRPPFPAEKRTRVPLAWICIAAIGRAQRAIDSGHARARASPARRRVDRVAPESWR